jgi:hypothetical protein
VRVGVEEGEGEGVDTDGRDNIITGGDKDHSYHILGRVLGLDYDKEKGHEQGEGWKEFKRGKLECTSLVSLSHLENLLFFSSPPHNGTEHRYLHIPNLVPAAFPSSANPCPPLRNARLHSQRRRAQTGDFHFKLSCHIPLLVVTAPSIGAGEAEELGTLGQ